MKTFLIKLLYHTYPQEFQDCMVEDMIGRIPKDVREPSVAFLSKGKDILTRYFLFQSYSLQRKAVSDLANSERYQGMLVFMKFLLSLLETAPTQPKAGLTVEEEKPDPLSSVVEFQKGMKELKNKKTP